MRKEIKVAKKKGHKVDEERVRKGAYSRARADAKRRNDITWSAEIHEKIRAGEPAELRSKTRINAEQVLAIGLPDLAEVVLPGQDDESVEAVEPPVKPPEAPEFLPAYMNLNIATVVENLLLTERERREAHKLLAQVTDNLKAMNIVNEHGVQVEGDIIGELNGMDGLFIYFLLMNHQLDYEQCRQLIEFLVDHNVIQRKLDRKKEDKRREWIKTRCVRNGGRTPR